MPSYVPIMPSGAAKGILIQIANTATTLHDSVIGTAHMDEVFVWVCNTSASDVLVTLEIEGTTVAQEIQDLIPARAGLVLMLPGGRFQDTVDIDAVAATTNVCNALVIVNRILLTDALTGA